MRPLMSRTLQLGSRMLQMLELDPRIIMSQCESCEELDKDETKKNS